MGFHDKVLIEFLDQFEIGSSLITLFFLNKLRLRVVNSCFVLLSLGLILSESSFRLKILIYSF
jgi:hypothetical protein